MQDLRRQLRQQRKGLLPYQQRQTEIAVLNRLRHCNIFRHAQHIGVYLDAFGEIRTNKIIRYAFACGKKVYLPTICAMNQRLVWVQISAQQYRNQRFAKHRLGMQQAMASRGLPVHHLDLLLLPLLACDQTGTRIGMGGGFYDRTLATAPHRPFRLGLAHDFQYITSPLQRQSWDQPLDALITPTQWLKF